MELSVKWLLEHGACEEGIEWFRHVGVIVNEAVIKRLQEEHKYDWVVWLIVRTNWSGLLEGWYEDAQLWYRGNYKDGKEDGLHEGWYKSGQLWYRRNYKDGIEIKEEGA